MTWVVRPLADVLAELGSPRIIAIDGGSSAGKTTLASRIPGAAVVHTDDIAWHHSRFGWEDLLIAGVIEPFRRGEAISYRPPQWDVRGRGGAVEVPAGAPLLVIEGVGSARPSLRPLVDAAIWIETDTSLRDARDVQRVAAGETTTSDKDAWLEEEVPFLAAQRAWELADVVVDGSFEHPTDVRVRQR